jgi:hypothetical protein
LVPLIKDDLEQGKEAAERAGLPYYQAAGEKLWEAKAQLKHGEFNDWVKRNFGISKGTAWRYMKLAKAAADEKFSALNFSSMRDFFRQTCASEGTGKTSWHEPVKQVLDGVDLGAIRQAQLSARQEREAKHKLALQLIDIGYRALATKLHPDKGGSPDAMGRLNQVRDQLKRLA